MLPYNPNLKSNARRLRKTITDAEQLLWFRIRKKQIQGVQFYRQKPIGDYIIDFYAVAIPMQSLSVQDCLKCKQYPQTE